MARQVREQNNKKDKTVFSVVNRHVPGDPSVPGSPPTQADWDIIADHIVTIDRDPELSAPIFKHTDAPHARQCAVHPIVLVCAADRSRYMHVLTMVLTIKIGLQARRSRLEHSGSRRALAEALVGPVRGHVGAVQGSAAPQQLLPVGASQCMCRVHRSSV